MNEKVDKLVLENKEKLFEAASRLIKIKSVATESAGEGKPFGEGVAKVLEEALKIGEELGFKTKNVDGYGGHIEFGENGILFGVLGHLDVVPEGEGWSVDPYGGIIKDGYLWGRGAVDNKGPTVATIFALKAVKDSGIVPKNRVRIILGTDEEAGWNGIKYYFQKEEVPKYAVTPDASFTAVYAEKGIVNYEITYVRKTSNSNLLYLKGGEASNVVPQKTVAILKNFDENTLEFLRKFRPKNESRIAWEITNKGLQIEAYGKSAHGSKPEAGVNAIASIVDVLSNLLSSDDDTYLFIKIISEKIGYETDGKSLKIAGSDCVTGSLTVNLGLIEMTESELKAVINVRYPIYYSFEMMTNQVVEALKPLTVKVTGHLKPLFISPDSDLIKLLCEVYTDVTKLPPTLITMGGGTYARAVPCGVAFGPLLPGRPETEHQPNERILLEDLLLVARIYAQLFYRVLSGELS
ncbi:dipeptidase PepV [Pseudothermotoga thermarum]|uniref:Dipeptidase n=1 Tax=Pseudothermotoga thermarum DSM 5069 TaxID=688269 RepID=F7YYG7_9THEM|nr:dipeptidase PepV [Pseudothermotoga thermarum]AEH50991.1 dipeptidase [Pseudothermotoga thermarum DSM 5069]